MVQYFKLVQSGRKCKIVKTGGIRWSLILQRIDTVCVKDLESSLEWYTTKLGLKLRWIMREYAALDIGNGEPCIIVIMAKKIIVKLKRHAEVHVNLRKSIIYKNDVQKCMSIPDKRGKAANNLITPAYLHVIC
ncbi:VOC family protein [Paenibacillus sp. J2TS4]|uniref:VOC family protein n=1 Tax=Paenibacillus sp. J2TS4 TaxID=2807194 RepID=UPI001AFF3544|nr:hypothetical protein J2TS4_19750 [Paenibacillus sp. J2TS4]